MPIEDPSTGGLPTFSNRIDSIPEYFCEAPHWLGDPESAAARTDEQAPEIEEVVKAKSAMRRKQRQTAGRWSAMNARNNECAAHIVETVAGLTPAELLGLGHDRARPRGPGSESESESPQWLPPPPPMPSPRNR